MKIGIITRNREIIQNKLLESIQDGKKVALILSQEDLDIIITALYLGAKASNPVWKARLESMENDLLNLRSQAFGK